MLKRLMRLWLAQAVIAIFAVPPLKMGGTIAAIWNFALPLPVTLEAFRPFVTTTL